MHYKSAPYSACIIRVPYSACIIRVPYSACIIRVPYSACIVRVPYSACIISFSACIIKVLYSPCIINFVVPYMFKVIGSREHNLHIHHKMSSYFLWKNVIFQYLQMWYPMFE